MVLQGSSSGGPSGRSDLCVTARELSILASRGLGVVIRRETRLLPTPDLGFLN